MTSAHRPWTTGPAALEDALPRHGERVLSKALTFRAGGTMYCVKTRGPGIALRGVKVTLHHFLCSGMAVHYKDRVLPVTAYGTSPIPDPAEDEKTINVRIEAIVAAKLMPSHRPCLTGVDNIYSLRHLLIARSQALPTPLHRRQEDISTGGNRGHFYFGLTDFRSKNRTSKNHGFFAAEVRCKTTCFQAENFITNRINPIPSIRIIIWDAEIYLSSIKAGHLARLNGWRYR